MIEVNLEHNLESISEFIFKFDCNIHVLEVQDSTQNFINENKLSAYQQMYSVTHKIIFCCSYILGQKNNNDKCYFFTFRPDSDIIVCK